MRGERAVNSHSRGLNLPPEGFPIECGTTCVNLWFSCHHCGILCVYVCVCVCVCRQKTPVDSEQEPSDDNEDEWTYPERKRETHT